MKYIEANELIDEIERRKQNIVVELDNLSDVDWKKPINIQKGTEMATYDLILSLITSLQQEQPEVDLKEYISNKLRELGADLIHHKPYSFNRGLNVGKTNAYHDILDRLNARKEE